ncbi:hypothetical protein N781_15005 [Pontibacillus halophilus JSM 076056 = DSM 19796]|uniref:Uncharacterized protein n=1 Tax=Pontibacillus halophilus JSM 076056 = DSM 19796 TaxID=1385510 RepID=A0A0A5GNF5_9BACI|nr:hypothetical protein [Pontibacillus halophilus]KGX92783.1 hypothetical protein N781_15005 [Pontibacillus halophilus JSM 076056 = DSM 19796]
MDNLAYELELNTILNPDFGMDDRGCSFHCHDYQEDLKDEWLGMSSITKL